MRNQIRDPSKKRLDTLQTEIYRYKMVRNAASSPSRSDLTLFPPQVLLWDASQAGAVIRHPVRVVLMPVHHRYPSEALLLSVAFSSDGSRLAVTSKDRRVRVLDPRAGKILQVRGVYSI